MVILLGLCSFLLSTARAQDILPLFKYNDIVYYGEQHDVNEHHKPLLEALNKGVARGIITTFATEYVPAQAQKRFAAYLGSPTSTKDSMEEKEFFNSLQMKWELMWARSERNREFYRFLRNLKQVYGEKIEICGIDYQDPVDVRRDWDNEDKPGPKLKKHIREVYKSIPQTILAKILETSGQSVDELVKNGDRYYREASMAVNLNHCIRNAKKVLVHTGMYHNHRVDAPSEEWWTLSRLHSLFTPAPFKTIANLRQYIINDPEELKDPETNAFQVLQLHYKDTSSKMVPSEALSADFVKILQIIYEQETVDFTKMWDYFILAPVGTKVLED